MKRLILSIAIMLSSIYASQSIEANGEIYPRSVKAGESLEVFKYQITLTNGTADSFSIQNPFIGKDIIVIKIKVGQQNQYIANQSERPPEAGYASWSYDVTENKLIILTCISGVSDSITITFALSIPQILGKNNKFVFTFDDSADPTEPLTGTDNGLAVEILPNDLNQLLIEDKKDGTGEKISSLSLTTDQIRTIYSVGRDRFGNFIRSVKVDWTSSDDGMTLNPSQNSDSTILEPWRIGTYTIRADSASFHAETGSINIKCGNVSYIIIDSMPNGLHKPVGLVEMTTDDVLSLYAAGYDRDSNYVGDVEVSWGRTGSLDIVNGTGSKIEFSPVSARTSGKIYASGAGLVSDSTGLIAVNPGKVQGIVIVTGLGMQSDTVEAFNLSTDDDTVLWVAGYDGDGNFVENVSVKWSVSGQIGSLTTSNGQSTCFEANWVGKGTVMATYTTSYGSFKDEIEVGVTGGNIHYLIIRDAPNGAGSEVDIVSLSTDSCIVLYSAGYDADSNYIGDLNGIWNCTGNLGLTEYNGKYLVFEPQIPNTSGKIFVTVDGEYTDSTGLITVISPPIISYVLNSMTPVILTHQMDTSFSITLVNLGDIGVEIDTRSFIEFFDTNGVSYQAYLKSGIQTNSKEEVTLIFVSQKIDSLFLPGQYTPLVTLFGRDSHGHNFLQKRLITEYNGLSIVALQIIQVGTVYNSVTTGQANIPVSLIVKNTGPKIITDLSAYLVFETTQGDYDIIRIDTVSEIFAGEMKTLSFIVNVKENALIGTVRISGSVRGRCGNILVFNERPLSCDEWKVNTIPSIEYIPNSIYPNSFTKGQSMYITCELKNTGPTHVNLLAAGSLVKIVLIDDTLSAYLHDDVELLNNGETQLVFFNIIEISSSVQPGKFYPSIELMGIDDNGYTFIQTLYTEPIVIVRPAHFEINSSTLSYRLIQGVDTSLSVLVINTGGIEAILKKQLTTLKFTDGNKLFSTSLINDQLVGKGETVNLKFYSQKVDSATVLGSYPIVVEFGYTDSNNYTTSDIDTLPDRIINVISAPNFYAGKTGVLPKVVRCGQDVSFTVEINNIGQAGFFIDSTSYIYLYDKLYGTYQSYIRNPVLVPGSTNSYFLEFMEGKILTSFLPGWYQMTIFLNGKDENNIKRNYVIEIDSITVLNESELVYVSSSFYPDTVTQGQEAVQFTLKVINTGDVQIILNENTELKLTDGIINISTYMGNYPLRIKPDSVATLIFNICDVPNSFKSGSYNPQIIFKGTDEYGVPYEQDIVTINDLVIIQSEPDIEYLSHSLTPQNITQGQYLDSMCLDIKNYGQADLIVFNDDSYLLIKNLSDSVKVLFKDTLRVSGFGEKKSLASRSLIIPTTFYGKYGVLIVLNGVDSNGKLFQKSIYLSDSISITKPPKLSITGFTPSKVTQGQLVSMSIFVNNSGEVSAKLDTNTFFQLKADDYVYQTKLKQEYLLKPQTDTRIEFKAGLILPDFININLNPAIHIYGKDDNLKLIDTIITCVQMLKIDMPPMFVMGNAYPDSIIAGQNNVCFKVAVTNIGEASAELNTNTVIQIGQEDYLSETKLVSPCVLESDEEETLLFQPVAISKSFPSGNSKLKFIPNGIDGNGRSFPPILTDTLISMDSLKIFHGAELIYISESLFPQEITNGQKTKFSVQIYNGGDIGVTIKSSLLTLGSYSISKVVNKYLLADSSYTIVFDSCIVNLNETGTIIPQLVLENTYFNNFTYSDTLSLTKLNVFIPPDIVIQNSTLIPKKVTLGQKFCFNISLNNMNPLDIVLDTNTAITAICPYHVVTSHLKNSIILPDSQVTVIDFNPIQFDSTFMVERYSLHLDLLGHDQNGKEYQKKVSLTDITLLVQSGPSLSYVDNSLTPIKITKGSFDIEFTVALSNHGDVGLILNPDSTTISFFSNGDTLSTFLKNEYMLNSGDEISITFRDLNLHSLKQGHYSPTLFLLGRDDNGKHYRQMVSLVGDSLWIQLPPAIVYEKSSNHPDFICKGYDFYFWLYVKNVGEVNAVLDTSSYYCFHDDRYSVISKLAFETEVSKNSTRLIFNVVTIPSRIQKGAYTSKVFLFFKDENDNAYQDSISINDGELEIFDPPDISITKVYSPTNKVEHGETDIPLDLIIFNKGEYCGWIDSVGLNFYFGTINDTKGYLCRMVPDNLYICGGEFDTIHFTVDVLGSAVFEQNITIDAQIEWSPDNSISIVKIMSSDTTHHWIVKKNPLFTIEKVIVSQDTVNVNQKKPWSVSLVVSNKGPSDVILTQTWLNFYNGPDIDDIFHYISPDTFINSHFGSGTQLPSGITDTLIFNVVKTGFDVSNPYRLISGFIIGEETESGRFIGDSIALNDTKVGKIYLQKPPLLEIQDIISSPKYTNSNQTSPIIKINMIVKNIGEAPVKIIKNSVNPVNLGFIDCEEHLDNTILIDSVYTLSDSILSQNETASIEYTIIKNTENLGWIDIIIGNFYGINLTDPDSTFEFAGKRINNLFYSQIPGELALIGTRNLTNKINNTVLPSQEFTLRTYITNLGAEKIRAINVQAIPLANETIVPPTVRTITLLDSLETDSVEFIIKAPPDYTGNVSRIAFEIINSYAVNICQQAKIKTGRIEYSYYVVSQPPEIVSVRYIDGGFNDIPDGIINAKDLIKVSFDEDLIYLYKQADINRLPKADEMFFILTPNQTLSDAFGHSAVVKTSTELQYTQTDRNSVIFIELGNDAILANNSASNRSGGGTVLKAERNPSHIIINPAIAIGMISGNEGNDPGLDIYQEVLNNQIANIVNSKSDFQDFSKYALIVDDGIPPNVLRFYPHEKYRENYISPFTNIKAFISGRNFIAINELYNRLRQLLEMQYSATLEERMNLMIDLRSNTVNYTEIQKSLKTLRSVIPDHVNNFVASLKNYSPIDDPETIYVQNPFALMFTEVTYIEYKYSKSGYNSYNKENSEFNSKSENEILTNDIIPGFNFFIHNEEPLTASGSSIDVWMNVKTCVASNTIEEKQTISIGYRMNGLKTFDGYTLRAAPNPYNPDKGNMTIEYELPDNISKGELIIIDSGGNYVYGWNCSGTPKGLYRIPGGWNGRNGNGKKVSEGIYIIYLSLNGDVKASWIFAVK